MSLLTLFQGNLAPPATLSANLSATSSLSAILGGAGTMLASLVAASGLAATLVQPVSLAGSLSASTALAATLLQPAALAASLAAHASLTATLSAPSTLSSSMNAVSALSGTLAQNPSGAIGAAIGASTALSGTLIQPASLSAILLASSTLSGSLLAIQAYNALPSPQRTLQITEAGSSGGAFILKPDGIPVIIHSPTSMLDYTFDWGSAPWLQPGESIIQQNVTADLGIFMVAPNNLASNAAQVQIWLGAATPGETYLVTCQVLTNYGRGEVRSFRAQSIPR